MSNAEQPPPAFPASLSLASEAIKTLDRVQISENWQWHPSLKRWVISCKLRSSFPATRFIPAESDWFVAVNPQYPNGSITFYPSKIGGITATFQHQLFNGESEDSFQWRKGHICLATPRRIHQRHSGDPEPRSAELRLKWNFLRALEWIDKAAQDQLVEKGDPFELPDFPSSREISAVFSEDARTYQTWTKIKPRYGLVKFKFLKTNTGVLAVSEFQDLSKTCLHQTEWNRQFENFEKPVGIGIWLLFNEVLVVEPWQAPTTWGELIAAAHSQGIDLYWSLKRLFQKIRDGHQHVALLGFPIPEKVGEEIKCIFWKPFLLPKLSQGDSYPKGFRKNEEGYFENDRRTLISSDEKLRWVHCENWASSEILSRGGINEVLQNKKIAIIGAGAVGSVVAELLIRGGAKNITIVDSDLAQAGNLTRHTLGLGDVFKNKATQLASHLMDINPHSEIHALDVSFDPANVGKLEKVLDSEIIVDCTGDDLTLGCLGDYEFEQEKYFISISISIAAKRLYLYLAKSNKFLPEKYHEEMDYWLRKDGEEFKEMDFPREGVGCWHPVFPAKGYDIHLMVSSALKIIDSELAQQDEEKLVILEQQSNGNFEGVMRMESAFLRFVSVDKKFGLKIYKTEIEKIRQICTKAGKNETGGALVGLYNEQLNCASVIDVSAPPKDSKAGSHWFVRGLHGLQKWLDSRWKKKVPEYYIGEWHFHPYALAKPSPQDLSQMAENATNPNYHCPEPILLIIGGDPQLEYTLSAFIVLSDKTKIELIKSDE